MLTIFLSFIDDEDDKELFMKAYKKYREGMIRFAAKFLRDNALAEDTVHDTFIKLAKGISHWRSFSEAQQKAYIFVSVKYQCISVYNKLKTEQYSYTFDENSFCYGDFIQDYCDEQEFLDFQKSLFASLPDGLVDVFVLKYSLNYKNKEIAEVLNISCNNVRQRVFRLNSILRKTLYEQRSRNNFGQAAKTESAADTESDTQAAIGSDVRSDIRIRRAD